MDSLRGFGFIIDYRYIGVFCIFFFYSTGCASIIPGRSVMIFVGVLCQQGYFNPYLVAPTAIAASIMGGNLGYIIGKYAIGNILTRRGRFIFISRAKVEKGMTIARRYGAKLIIPAMFVGGFWLLTSIIPGMIKIKYPKFAVVNGLGLIFWVIALMSAGYFGGYVWSETFMGRSYVVIIIIGIVLGLFVIWKLAINKLKSKM